MEQKFHSELNGNANSLYRVPVHMCLILKIQSAINSDDGDDTQRRV